jgi:hypothetical protein
MNRLLLQFTLAALVSLSAAAETTTFEEPEVSGVPTLLPDWSGFSPVVQQHGETRVQDTLAGTGNQALEMFPDSAVAWSPVEIAAPSGHVLVSSFQLRLDTLSTDAPVIPSESLGAVVFANATGLMALDGNGAGGGTWQNLQALAADTFYTITITRNYAAQTYDVEVDGTLVADNFGFKDPVAAGPFTATFETSERAWLDDVSATFVQSPDATALPVENFSFELPDITNDNITGVPTGWTAPNGSTGIGYRDNFAGLAANIPDGNQWAKITYNSANKDVTLAQNTGVTIVEGVTYTLSVAVGEQDNFAGVVNIARIFLYGSTTGETSPFALLDNIDPINAGASAWVDYTISFTATAAQAGQSLVIGLGAGSNIANGSASFNTNTSFDNVRLNATTIPSGSPVIYESFDYTAGSAVVGQNGGTGFGGAWTGTGTLTNNKIGTGLTFSNLPVAGGSHERTERTGDSAISRTISASAQALLTANNSTMWFSVLIDPLAAGNGFAVNSYGTLIFGDTALAGGAATVGTAPSILLNGNAIGVGFAGTAGSTNNFADMRIQGVTYKNGTASYITGDRIVVGDSVQMIVGRVDWAANATNDVLRLYQITDPSAPLPAPFTTLQVDLDQSDFNVLSIGDSQTAVFDEIRFGTSYADVISDTTPVNDFGSYISNSDFGLDPDEQGFDQDPDGDNLASGLEAWFGTHPNEFNSGITNLVTDGIVTTFTHPRNETPPVDISAFYQWSPNLIDWYACDGWDGPPAGPNVTISLNLAGATTTVTAEASEEMDRIFLRCGVTRN